MQMQDSAACFVHVHGLPFIIMVVMAGFLAVHCDVFQFGTTLSHRHRTEHGQRLAKNGKQQKERAKSAGHGVKFYPVLRQHQDCSAATSLTYSAIRFLK